MADLSISITAKTTSPRWTSTQISNEISFLRSSSSFISILQDVLPFIDGNKLNGIVITDSAQDFRSGKWQSAEQVQFNQADGNLYIGINPNQTAFNQADNRVLTVGELIAHGLSHFTQRAVEAGISNPGDIFGLSSERVAVEYTNRVASEFGLSQTQAFKVSTSFYGPLFCTVIDQYGKYSQPLYLQRCFIRGTQISLANGASKPIEAISVGDIVVSFNDLVCAKLDTKSVVNAFVNITTQLVELSGVFCTPGHVFLTIKNDNATNYEFETIANILRNDGVIVKEDGAVVRARTGVEINTANDKPVEITYIENHGSKTSNKKGRIIVRSGIPMPGTFLNDGAASEPNTLAQHLEAHGVTISSDGSLCTSDGARHIACNWPEGSTPFDTHEARNWIVEADGQPYTPPWIRDLVEEDEHQGLRVVGAMPTVAGSVSTIPAPL